MPNMFLNIGKWPIRAATSICFLQMESAVHNIIWKHILYALDSILLKFDKGQNFNSIVNYLYLEYLCHPWFHVFIQASRTNFAVLKSLFWVKFWQLKQMYAHPQNKPFSE